MHSERDICIHLDFELLSLEMWEYSSSCFVVLVVVVVCLFVCFCFVPFLELRGIRGNVTFILRPLYNRICGNVILIFAAT